MQGLGKFGFYEIFKHVYADLLGEVRTFIICVDRMRCGWC